VTPRPGYRTDDVRAEIAAGGPFEGLDDASSDGRIDTRVALIGLDEALPRDRLVFSDGGHYFGYPGMYLAVPEPDSFVLAANFGSIGLGLGTAIGGVLARPDRLGVLVVGDGGLLMSISELESAVRLGVRLVVVVVNDAAYGAEVHSLRAQGLAVDTAQFPETDFVTLAHGFGATAMTVCTPADVKAAGEIAHGIDGPLVLDVKVDPDLVAPWYRAAKLQTTSRPLPLPPNAS
jgi:thiamine pyrophosphate-dependent acetolactate synthase large subunit-like protein